MTKGKGFMGGLEKLGFVESETPVSSQGDDSPAPVVAPPPQYSFQQPMQSFAAPVNLDAQDQQRMAALEAQVYQIPSTYTTFKRVRTSLNNTTDMHMLMSVLEASNPGVTPEKIRADIDQHLGIVNQKGAEFDAQVAQAHNDRVVQPNSQADALDKQNREAADQITARAAQSAKLRADATAADKQITDGTLRFKAIQQKLAEPLMQDKQALTSI